MNARVGAFGLAAVIIIGFSSLEGSTTNPESVIDVGKVEVQPIAQFQPMPTNAFWLFKSGVGGKALILFTIKANGSVSDTVVEDSTDTKFGVECAKGILNWKFKPGRIGGSAVPCKVKMLITFTCHLADGSLATVPPFIMVEDPQLSKISIWNSYDITRDYFRSH
jgi:TonB family protein